MPDEIPRQRRQVGGTRVGRAKGLLAQERALRRYKNTKSTGQSLWVDARRLGNEKVNGSTSSARGGRSGWDFGLTVPGCEAYEIHQGSDDPHRFMMVERWSSADAHGEHFEKNVMASGVFDKVAALMVAPPDPPVYFLLR